MRIYTLTINHKHGTDTVSFTKKRLLDKYLYAYVKNWWESEIPHKTMPKDKEEAIKQYFEHVGDRSMSEYYSVDEGEIDPIYQG